MDIKLMEHRGQRRHGDVARTRALTDASGGIVVSVQLNHTIVLARDNKQGAEFLAKILGIEVGPRFGPFVTLPLANDVTLDFYSVEGHTERLAHFAFLVSEEEFDGCFQRLETSGVTFYADPHLSRRGEINRDDGGRGVYFLDPTGNTMEIITRPYGGG